MARINKQYQRTAANQARAEIAPQIQSKRRGLHQEVHSLRSEEAPLNSGLENAEKTIRHSPLMGADKEDLLRQFAVQQAGVPAGITSQIASARENTGGEISDLQTQEAQQRASILSGLLTKAAEHKEGIADEIAAEGRGNENTLALAQQEKELGLGDYAPTPPQAQTPLEEQVETAGLHHIEAETAAEQAKAEGGGLTPSEQRIEGNEAEAKSNEHAAAAHWAKELVQEAQAGKIVGKDGKPTVPANPQEFTPQIWNELVSHVAKESGAEIPAAEKAVGAVRDHFETAQPLPFNLIGKLAAAAGPAIAATGHAQTPAGPRSLLGAIAPLQNPGSRY